MVSFQCEGCGDVQTKKKLDSHRSHCHAPFTCIDCMTTFRGTEYKSHTSCMTEDQKYQGHLYREKPTKASKRKSVAILEPTDQNALVPRKAYVEDVAEIDVPPHVPSPPPAVPAKPADSVFDYLVEDETPDTPRITYTDNKGEMAMKNGAPPLFSSRPNSRSDYRNKEEQLQSTEYSANGFSYGAEPVNPRPLEINGSMLSLEFMTPAAKETKAKLDRKVPESATHSRTNSGATSEKKRKRGQNGDTVMAEAPDPLARSVVDTPGIAHSGLTGGLSRMLTNGHDNYPFHGSPDTEPERHEEKPRTTRRSTKHDEPASPLKRTRRTKEDTNGLGISIKGRAGRVVSMIGGALGTNVDTALTKTRRRASSSDHTGSQTRGRESENRDRKKHKVHRHNGTSRDNVRHEHHRPRRHGSDDSPDGSRRRPKAIEYYKPDYSNSDSEENRDRGEESQMVVFGQEEKMRKKCEGFLSYVKKGPDSGKGYSINKALKRWHRDNDVRSTTHKQDEEKDLWKGLRLKKNERGEIVVFFQATTY